MIWKLTPAAPMLAFLLTATVLPSGAAETGQVTGTVKDPAQAVIAGANVALKDLQGRVKATAISDANGVYAFASVEPGNVKSTHGPASNPAVLRRRSLALQFGGNGQVGRVPLAETLI